MTRKDYILIAKSIYRSKMVKEATEKNKIKRQAMIDALHLVANDLAGSLYGDNPQFNRDKFLTACGF